MATVPWVVRQGQYLVQIAARVGVDPNVIWTDPANADLSELRGDGSVLLAGDVLYVPVTKPCWMNAAVGSTNRYVANVPIVQVTVKLQFDGAPCAGEPYRVLGGATVQTGTTDGAGTVKFTVPVTIHAVNICLDGKEVQVPVRVGYLDPLDTASGLVQRLQHLGYLGAGLDFSDGGAPGELLDLVIAAAVSDFQTAVGLATTGQADGQTLAALEQAHGC